VRARDFKWGQGCVAGRNNKEREYIVISSNMRRTKEEVKRIQRNVWMSWYLPGAKGKWKCRPRKGKSSLRSAACCQHSEGEVEPAKGN